MKLVAPWVTVRLERACVLRWVRRERNFQRKISRAIQSLARMRAAQASALLTAIMDTVRLVLAELYLSL